MIPTALTELLEIEHPVLCAPMGGVTGGRLAAAVSRAGGLGLIGGGYGDADWLETEFAAAGNARVGCGFITWSLARQPALLDRALNHAPAAMMLSFGDPTPFAPCILAAGAKLMCQVQTLDQAKAAMDVGAHAIVAQGSEAGGHGAGRGTMALVPAVVDAVAPTPVIAAGGIADGRGIAASLMLGAQGVLIGTRFFTTPEALGHDAARARIVSAGGDDTLRTTVFDTVRGLDWPARYTGRAIGNAFSARWHGDEKGLGTDLSAAQQAYAASNDVGDVETAAVFAGECIDLIESVEPAGDLVARIVADAEEILRARTATLTGG
jgi:nitronate monooxygenase